MKTFAGLDARKAILDPVHATIPITAHELAVISTPLFQRLRGVTQLGMAPLVYPGAVHNRFQHSLGTMHVVDKLLDTLRQENSLALGEADWDRVIQKMRLAALLHDCAHLPFSHTFEKYQTEKGHEFFCQVLIQRSPLAAILKNAGFNPSSIASLLTGKVFIGDEDSQVLTQLLPLLHSDADADRMDYLLRDTYFTGVPFGKIDLDRICLCVSLHEGHICFSSKAQDSLEHFLFARYQMYKKVYTHKTVICYDLLVRKIYDILNKYKAEVPFPFVLPAPTDFSENPSSWYEEKFCPLAENDFPTSVSAVLKSSAINVEDREDLEALWARVIRRRSIKLAYRKDAFPRRVDKNDLSHEITEYCDKDRALFQDLQANHPEIVGDWSFLRHDPSKPIPIATPIDADYADDQDFTQIRILKGNPPSGMRIELLQEAAGTFLRELATHHRILILYYHRDRGARETIQALAREYMT